VFLGRSVTQTKQVSDVTAHAIDEEVRRVIETNYNRASEILQKHLDKLHAMAEALMRYETIDDSQIRQIMDGQAPTPPVGWDSSLGGGTPGATGGSPPEARPAFGPATRNRS
jgi:cell division protease FtsH